MAENKLGSIDIVLSMETKEFNKAVSEVSKDSKELRKDFRVLDAELKNVEKTEESMAKAGKQLSNVLDRQKSYVQQLENAQARLRREGKEGSGAFQRMSDNLRNARIDVERTKTSINKLNSEMSKLHSKKVDIEVGGTGGLKEGLAGLGKAGALGGVIAGLGMVGAKSLETAEKFNHAQKTMQNSLGLSEKEMKEYNKTMNEINQDGLTQDVEESARVLVALKQNLGDLADEDMKKFGEQTVAVSNILESDFNETLRSSKQLTNIFGDDTEKTFDMITVAVQDGVNAHQDLLDTINEYSTYFKQAGFSSEEFFAILDQGLQNGIMNTDKVADGVKEFQIALNDGRIQKGLSAWSTQTQRLFTQYQTGKATAKDVFNSMVGDINRVKDTEQKQQLINATGISQWEDWGTAGFNNLDKVDKKAYTTAGSVQKIVDVEKQHANGWKRLLGVADAQFFNPIGSKLNNFVNDLADAYGELTAYQKRIDAVKHAPLVSPAGYYSNPLGNVGKKPAYQSKSTTIIQNNYSPKTLDAKEMSKVNKKLANNMGKSW